ncbi:hypothetical protein ACAW74_00290 [Fibrella sp. WM1]|uniref:hypothetical protein n=1 Tax=Fibrella musci TaxID=3242485 RepID=UPI00352087DF
MYVCRCVCLLLSLLAFTATAQTPPDQQQAMRQGIAALNTLNAQTPVADMIALANQFDRVASAQANEWLPRYYAGLTYVYLGFIGKDEAEKDTFLDRANTYLTQADKLSPNNDELSVLRAYIAQARISVDAANRWQTYGPQFEEAIGKAMAQNPNNPRPYVLKGLGLIFTPDAFGGGPKTACPILKMAAEKLATFKPASDIAPAWGQSHIDPVLSQCN